MLANEIPNTCLTGFRPSPCFSILRREGLRGRVTAERSLLTDQNRATRLQFARQQLQLHPDPEYWRAGIFMDEKSFDTAGHGRRIVYRRDGTRFSPQHVAQRQVNGRVIVHCCGWMDGQGRGSLQRLGLRFNQEAT